MGVSCLYGVILKNRRQPWPAVSTGQGWRPHGRIIKAGFDVPAVWQPSVFNSNDNGTPVFNAACSGRVVRCRFQFSVSDGYQA